jgi:chemotaxis signal transduction protein
VTAPAADGAGARDLAVLASRAADLARPLEQERATASVEVLLATVGGEQVAVPVEALREVRPPTLLAPVPGTSPALVGIVGGRGEALVVASLATLLGLASPVAPTGQWVLVLDDPAAPVGLLVDTVGDVVSVDSQDLSSLRESSALIAAVGPGGVLVLDIPAVLGDPRLFLSARTDPTEANSWQDA